MAKNVSWNLPKKKWTRIASETTAKRIYKYMNKIYNVEQQQQFWNTSNIIIIIGWDIGVMSDCLRDHYNAYKARIKFM